MNAYDQASTHERIDRLRYRLAVCEDDDDCDAIEEEIAELEQAVNPRRRKNAGHRKNTGRRNGRKLELNVAVLNPQGATQYSITAERVGENLVVHPSIRTAHEIYVADGGAPGSYAITHVPTGQLVANVRTAVAAKQLAKEINGFAGPGIASMNPAEVQYAIGGPDMARADYIFDASALSWRAADKLPTYAHWSKHAQHNPASAEDRKSRAAVSAAIGSLIGGVIGAVVGAIGGGALGLIGGSLIGGPEGAIGGLIVGAVFGIPLGVYIGTIWGAVRQTGKALEGIDAGSAKLAAGVGSAFLGPIGAGLGAYLGA